MKNIYLLLLASLSLSAYAQQSTSFEGSEGYETGTIHGQNGWEVTEGSDGLITNQVITNEAASDGTLSFKNAFEPAFDPQWFPIFGASQSFAEPADYNNFTVSYDVMVTETNGSDFEFILFAINADEEFVPVAGVGIENRGYIYVTVDENYGFEYAEAGWTPNEWVNIKIEVNANEIKYYVNNVLQNTIANFTQLNISGLNMLHNNYGADGYYDNFVITTGNLDSPSFEADTLSVYPNPFSNTLSVVLPEHIEVSELTIYNITGQQVLQTSALSNINVSSLAAGTYLLQVKSNDGSLFTKKIVKI